MSGTTIRRAASDRQLKDADDLIPWANREMIPLVKDIREFANQDGSQVFTLSTAGTGAFATIWTSDAMPTNSTWHVYVKVQARTTAGAAQACSYTREAYFTSVAGVASQVGATASIATFESAAAADVQFALSGQTVLFQVKDDGVSTFAWKCRVVVFPSEESAT